MIGSIPITENKSDREFIEDIYTQYHRLMYKKIFEIVRDKWAVDDVLQELLIRLIGQVSKLRTLDQKQLLAYLVVAAQNRARNYIRDNQKHNALSIDEMSGITDSENDKESIEQRLIRKSELECFEKVWQQLDDKTRYILQGYYILEQPSRELAKELGLTEGSFRMALSRARKTAYEIMRKMYGEIN